MERRLSTRERVLIEAFVSGRLRLDELPDELHALAWEAALDNAADNASVEYGRCTMADHPGPLSIR